MSSNKWTISDVPESENPAPARRRQTSPGLDSGSAPNSDKPKWLRKLERESWQAELIISGAAIFGSLQLPALLERFQYYLLLNYEESALILWFYASVYWALVVYLLIFLFIYHFVIRALWIGMVGLNSVYPEGFAPNKLSSEDFQAKARAEYGDIDGFIRKLDERASGLFGTGFTFAGLFLNLGLIISFCVLIVTFVQGQGIPQFWAWAVGLSPALLIFLASIVSTVLSLPALREREWVKRYHFPFTKVISKLSYPVNTRFTLTGLTLISSQSAAKAKSGWALAGSFLFSMSIFGVIGFTMATTGVMKREFISSYYHRMGDTEATLDPNNYYRADQEDLLYEPLVNERYPVAGGPFWVWVPLPERELSVLLGDCSLAEVPEDLPRNQERKREKERITDCAREYIELYLDGTPVPLPDPLRHWLTSADTEQFGVQLNLSELPLEAGRHELKVVTHLTYEDEEVEGDNFRMTFIPFFVVEGR